MNKDFIQLCKDIFKRHSVTYYYATLLFPKKVRENVFVLYAFVRLADEVVDNPGEKDPKKALQSFQNYFNAVWIQHDSVEDTGEQEKVIKGFVCLAKAYEFEKKWIDAFFQSMEWDLWKNRYETKEELEQYMYGSAEVIGLMMAKIMKVPVQYMSGAQALGTTMQLINFTRDIYDDRLRGRRYIPHCILAQAHVTHEEWMMYDGSPDQRFDSIREHMFQWIEKYQIISEKSYIGIPWRCRFPVMLATQNYLTTLKKIHRHPELIFRTQIRATKWSVLRDAILLAFKTGYEYFV